MSTDLPSICKTLEKKINRSFSYHPLKDDALQEASIQAWKMLESGETDYTLIVYRAYGRARSFMSSRATLQPTGHAVRERSGTRMKKGDETRQKIRDFIDQYQELHGKKPLNKVVAEGLGLSPRAIGRQIRHMKDNAVEITHYIVDEKTGHRRIDKEIHKEVAVPWSELGSMDVNETSMNGYLKYVPSMDFEDDFLSEQDMLRLLSCLQEGSRKALYFTFWLGYTETQVAEQLGKPNNRQFGNRAIAKAKQELREVLIENGSRVV